MYFYNEHYTEYKDIPNRYLYFSPVSIHLTLPDGDTSRWRCSDLIGTRARPGLWVKVLGDLLGFLMDVAKGWEQTGLPKNLKCMGHFAGGKESEESEATKDLPSAVWRPVVCFCL